VWETPEGDCEYPFWGLMYSGADLIAVYRMPLCSYFDGDGDGGGGGDE
jgi:hypothetical protein